MDFTVLSLWALLYTAISHITTGLQPHLPPQQKKKLLWLGKALDFMVEPPCWPWHHQEPTGNVDHPSNGDATVDSSISHQDKLI